MLQHTLFCWATSILVFGCNNQNRSNRTHLTNSWFWQTEFGILCANSCMYAAPQPVHTDGGEAHFPAVHPSDSQVSPFWFPAHLPADSQWHAGCDPYLHRLTPPRRTKGRGIMSDPSLYSADRDRPRSSGRSKKPTFSWGERNIFRLILTTEKKSRDDSARGVPGSRRWP